MAVLWTQLADGGAFGDFSLLTDTVAQLEGLPFEQAFDRAVDLAVARGEATPTDAVLLREFGYGCGRTDMSGQQALLRAYREQLRMVGEEADRTARSKGQVYRMMGVAGGVALALLMV